MRKITTKHYPIELGALADSSFQEWLENHISDKQKIFILLDENILKSCYPHLMFQIPALKSAEILEIESGEVNKNIEICTRIWQALTELNADRDTLLINLGGGVITDLGGFIAGIYKRGIKFINIPTTLLAQVDASVGGKTGIDLDNLKNQLGLFNFPEYIFIDPAFLNTLPKREIISGYAEIVKHAMIADAKYWKKLQQHSFSDFDKMEEIIGESIAIKNEIVNKDPNENGLRKILNFGHTIGHAVESFSLENGGKSLLHGEAIAVGMICESFLSFKHNHLSKESLDDISNFIYKTFPYYPIEEIAHHRILELMKNDKKNKGNKLNFTLISEIGLASIDHFLQASDVKEALNYYRTNYAE